MLKNNFTLTFSRFSASLSHIFIEKARHKAHIAVMIEEPKNVFFCARLLSRHRNDYYYWIDVSRCIYCDGVISDYFPICN